MTIHERPNRKLGASTAAVTKSRDQKYNFPAKISLSFTAIVVCTKQAW